MRGDGPGLRYRRFGETTGLLGVAKEDSANGTMEDSGRTDRYRDCLASWSPHRADEVIDRGTGNSEWTTNLTNLTNEGTGSSGRISRFGELATLARVSPEASESSLHEGRWKWLLDRAMCLH
jgi:hypothetical protein